MRPPLALLEIANGVATITLNRPQRHNALIPELLEDLRAAIANATKADIFVLVLTGAGRSFSTGGDVAAFLEAATSTANLRSYASTIVGLLNDTILDLLAFPMPVIAAINGQITGGSAGFLFAADEAIISEAAFLQPYYVNVGFAPDGGWTALLPDRIGRARAIEIQAFNRRIGARAALALGLAATVAPAGELDIAIAGEIEILRSKERESLKATRRLIWTDTRRAEVAVGLEAERSAFVELVDRPEVRARMEAFVGHD